MASLAVQLLCPALLAAFAVSGCHSKDPRVTTTPKGDLRHPWTELAVVAGQPGGPGWVDGPRAAAHFTSPYGVAFDDGSHLYVLDQNSVRDIDLAQDTVETLAGQPNVVGGDDGTGPAAAFFHPTDAVFTDGALFLSDTENHALRRVEISTGAVATAAGAVGTLGNTDAVGTDSRFQEPEGVALDPASGKLYIGDTDNHTIRQVDIATLSVTTIAGAPGVSGAVDGVGAAARFSRPTVVTLDEAGRALFISDAGNQLVRRMGLDDLRVSAVAAFDAPAVGLAMDGPDLLASVDSGIVRVDLATGTNSPFVGSATQTGLVDGTGEAARFTSPAGMKNDGHGGLFVADSGNYSVRRVDLASGAVTTVAGANSSGAADGVGGDARFSKPKGVAVAKDDLIYVADTENHAIRGVKLTTGETNTLAGALGDSGSTDGGAATARFNRPSGIALDGDQYLYIAELGNHDIRRLDLTAGTVSTLTLTPAASSPGATLVSPLGLAFDDGHLYVTDGVTLLAVDLASGELREVAKDPGDSSVFAAPTGIVADSDGSVYVADALANTVTKVTVATGSVTTFVGRPRLGASASSTRLYYPSQVALRSDGTLFVADSKSVRQVAIADASVSTVVGSLDRQGLQPGPLPAQLGEPSAIGLSPEGSLIIVSESTILVAR